MWVCQIEREIVGELEFLGLSSLDDLADAAGNLDDDADLLAALRAKKWPGPAEAKPGRLREINP